MDIVTDTLEHNRQKAKTQSNSNLLFLSYDGTKYPLKDESIDIVVIRYALHHFRNLVDSFAELNELLEKTGFQFQCNKISNIRFPRKNPIEYKYLFNKYDCDIWQGYDIEIIDK